MVYDNLEIAEDKKMSGYCTHCDDYFLYFPQEIQTKHHGTYDAKITTCPHCKGTVIISTTEDSNLYVNNDPRYYR